MEFTVKTAYNIAHVSNSGSEDRMWKIIWLMGVPERVRAFI